jgi:uncharacterized membrane protein YkvA (DUF1232 family)
MSVLRKWRNSSGWLRLEIASLLLACRDPRTPWYAKALAAMVVIYTFSPIDLVSDPIPLIGYLDDLVVLPLGVFLVRRMIPPEVLAECRERARRMWQRRRVVFRRAAAVLLGICLLIAGGLIWSALE